MLVLEPIEFVPNPRNFLDFVKRRSGQLSGCRLDRPVALLVSIPQKEARSGIVEPLVRLAGPTISLRAFLEAAAQPGQNFRAQGSGLGEEPGRLPESAIQNLAFQPATKAIRARPPSRRCSRIDFHNNGGIVAGVQTNRPHADPLALDHERKELFVERVISGPSL
jgi:hypothetical protein